MMGIMKIAILGYGSQGRAAYEYWRDGNEITICDGNSKLELPTDVNTQLGADHLKGLEQFDLLVRSPIVHPRAIVAANSPDILAKVTTVTNEFLRVCPTKNVIGVTGTKGKGTTSTLIALMLEAAGHRVHLGGNIGIPPLDMLKNDIQPDDWVVLELANFQLIDLQHSPRIAVCLMVVPEHLDWHTDPAEYFAAKTQLFRWQTAEDFAIYFADNDESKRIAGNGAGLKIPYYQAPGAAVLNEAIVIDDQVVCRLDEIKLLGAHNWQNVCAAVTAVWQITQDIAALRSVIAGFSGLEHRLELVTTTNGVAYYDDSFGTTPETAIVALQAFSQPKVIILGGSDKGAHYDELAGAVVDNNVRHVIAIGATGPAITAALLARGYNNGLSEATTMPEIIKTAALVAEPGDVVLLSTACASFDMFANYKDRGEQFKAAVLSTSAS